MLVSFILGTTKDGIRRVASVKEIFNFLATIPERKYNWLIANN